MERYRFLCANLPAWRYTQAVQRYEGFGYESLSKIGTVSSPGTKDVQFVPFPGLQFPIRAQAALELLRCFSAVSAKGMPCVYAK
eukprot:6123086-Pleurochrysis_carterae.AAC.1